jgi:hypothetical protein
MARIKQVAKKNDEVDKAAEEERVQKLLNEHTWKWSYCMLRLIDIRNVIDTRGYVTADKILNKLTNLYDIYDIFDLQNDIGAKSHLLVGVQSRRYENDRLDAYILIGLRVKEDVDMSYYSDISSTFCDVLCKNENDIDIRHRHYHVIEGDEGHLDYLTDIINDMEDVAEEGERRDVVF